MYTYDSLKLLQNHHSCAMMKSSKLLFSTRQIILVTANKIQKSMKKLGYSEEIRKPDDIFLTVVC